MFGVFGLTVKVFGVDQTVRLNPLGARLIVKVIVALQALSSAHRLLNLKLYFRELRVELEGDFVNNLGS